MATKKISELNLATSIASNDVLPIVSDEETKKVTVQKLVNDSITNRVKNLEQENNNPDSFEDTYSCNYINSRIKDINDELIHIKGQLLWENPNPSNVFNPQTLTLDLSNYDTIAIVAKTHTSQNKSNTFTVPKICGNIDLYFSDNSNTYDRNAEITNTQISFSNARLNANTDNERCIPLYVIGYNYGLFN